MTDHHFISYSGLDAKDFSIKLCDSLKVGPPSISTWLNKRDMKPGEDWDEQLVEAIMKCMSLLFIMTRDSVKPKSVCKNESNRALKYKKPVIPILLHPDAEMPFRLGSRQYIDFTTDFEVGLAKLRMHIGWLAWPEGILHTLKDRLEDAERDLSRASPEQEPLIKDEINQLQKDIENQQRIIADPQGVKEKVEQSIKTAQERERQPERPVSGISCTKFINPPPGAAPDYFQDRTVETKLVVDFLKNDAQRMITVVGRGGMGKTAMVCRLLKSLESGKVPDNGGDMGVDGIVYLSEYGTHKVTVPNIFADMCRLLPDNKAKELDDIYKNPKASTEAKMIPLLEAFPSGRVILLLDNFENSIDLQTRNIKDTELDEALRAMLNLPQHAVKVIVTTRIAPKDLAFVHPERQMPLDLNKGLESPYAENILREMDEDGKFRLKNAPVKLLSEARDRTQGNPRALEHLFAILSNDRDTTLPDILADTKNLLPERVVEVLVGEAFSRLDTTAQSVMEALSVYARPVTPAAIDFMLSSGIPGIDSAPVLGRLLNMHLVRKEEGRYYLHPVDRAYAFSRIPSGKPDDRDSDEGLFTQFALLHRGADYFEQVRTPREEWKTKADLEPQIAEFELRYAGEDHETAARVLLDIDFNLLVWGHYKTVIDMHERLQGKLADVDLMGRSSGNLGTAYYSVCEYQKAIKYYEKALDIARKNNTKQGEGTWLGNLGNAYSDLGQVEKAIEYYEQALAISREVWDREGEGAWLGNLGNAYNDLAQVEKAIEHYEDALAISREIGDRQGEGSWLGSLGRAYSYLGQVEKAIEHYEQALAISREIGDRRGEGSWLGSLGNVYSDLGQVEKAIEHHEQALAISRDIGDRYNESVWLGNLGRAYSGLGQVEKAIEHYEQARVISREIGSKRNEGSYLGNIGVAYSDLGQVEKAIEYYEKALVIAREIGNKYSETNQLINLGDSLVNLNQPEKALMEYDRAVLIAEGIKNQQNQNEARYGQALARLICMDVKGALSSIEAASRYEYPPNDHNVLALAGVIALRMGETKAAKNAFITAITKADEMLAKSKNNYGALYAKGLALSGLALCEGDRSRVAEANSAYKAAREINGYTGTVGRARMLFDELAKADGGGMIKDVRAGLLAADR